MAGLHLPRGDAQLLAKLASLDLKLLSPFFDSIRSIEPSIYHAKKIKAASSDFAKSHGLDPNDIARVVRSINQTRESLDHLADAEFVKEILAGVGDALPDDSQVDPGALQTVVVNLLSLSGIRVSTKAANLAFDNQNCLLKVRIISDLRSVFDESREGVEAMFIANTLKISYLENGADKERSIFFALDDSDLEAIEAAIQQVRKKKAVLTELVEKTGVTLLEMKQ